MHVSSFIIPPKKAMNPEALSVDWVNLSQLKEALNTSPEMILYVVNKLSLVSIRRNGHRLEIHFDAFLSEWTRVKPTVPQPVITFHPKMPVSVIHILD
jgi:hypothetical protein